MVRLLVSFAVLCLSCGIELAQVPPGSVDYTKDLPSVQRIETELKGSDANDTLARQSATLEYLQQYIQRIKEARDFRGRYSPGEQKLLTDYAKAAYELTQSYAKAHTPDEVKAFNRLKFNYEINNALNWIRQLEGPLAADAYKAAEAKYAETSKQHQQRIQQQTTQQQTAQQSQGAASGVAGVLGDIFEVVNDSPDARRCLELGGTSAECAGDSMKNLASKWIGSDPNAAPPVNGVVLSGDFRSRSQGASLSFGAGAVTLQNCGALAADSRNYGIRNSGGATQLIIANEPNNIVLTLHPDRTLSGPGVIPVKGRVITAYRKRDDCNAAIHNCVTVTDPIYEVRMDRCSLSELAFVPAAPTPKPHVIAGFRMTGLYTGPSGLRLEFGNDAVVMDCGQAHAKAPYSVESTATQYVVRVQNSGGPFLLAVEADGTLRGSGSTTVNGRLVTAIKGGSASFAPHSQSCNIGTLSPKGTRSTAAR